MDCREAQPCHQPARSPASWSP